MAKRDVVVEGREKWIDGVYRETGKAIGVPVEQLTHAQVWDYLLGATDQNAHCSILLIHYRPKGTTNELSINEEVRDVEGEDHRRA
jgi:hypothetical protein